LQVTQLYRKDTDAGHSASAITDRYVDVELKERANTARDKGFG